MDFPAHTVLKLQKENEDETSEDIGAELVI